MRNIGQSIKLKRQLRVTWANTDPRFRPWYTAWPELWNLRQQAEKRLGRDVVKTLDKDIMGGLVTWIPEKNQAAAYCYVLLRAAGIEVPAEKARALGLEEIARNLNETAKSYRGL